MTTSIAYALSVILVHLVAQSSGQFLANDYVKAPSFNSTLYISGPGGRQQVLYEDAQSGVDCTWYPSLADEGCTAVLEL